MTGSVDSYLAAGVRGWTHQSTKGGVIATYKRHTGRTGRNKQDNKKKIKNHLRKTKSKDF
jgi:hypothetical protein